MHMLQNFKQSFLSNPVLTAEWENELQEIEHNPKKSFQFLNKLNSLTVEIISGVKNNI